MTRVFIQLSFVGALAGGIVGAGPTSGQGFPTVTPRPDAELGSEFTSIVGIYELADKRVIVVDQADATIVLADFVLQSVTPLGRRGAGPGEYRAPKYLYPLGGDSVGVLDDAAGRLIVVKANGRVGSFLSPRSTDTQAGMAAAARFADGRGYFYGEGASVREAADGSVAAVDSAPILRWPVAGGASTRIAYLPRPLPIGARVAGGVVVAPPGAGRPALISRSLWAVAPDGRVAVVHPYPYRVELIESNPRRLVVTRPPFTPAPVTDSVKQAYMDERAGAESFIIDANSGRVSIQRDRRQPAPPASWGAYVPPFRSDALIAFDSRGRLWIQRTTFGKEGTLYDVIGPHGDLVSQVRLPQGHRVVGFGREAVYVVRRDSDDVEHLLRQTISVGVRARERAGAPLHCRRQRASTRLVATRECPHPTGLGRHDEPRDGRNRHRRGNG